MWEMPKANENIERSDFIVHKNDIRWKKILQFLKFESKRAIYR